MGWHAHWRPQERGRDHSPILPLICYCNRVICCPLVSIHVREDAKAQEAASSWAFAQYQVATRVRESDAIGTVFRFETATFNHSATFPCASVTSLKCGGEQGDPDVTITRWDSRGQPWSVWRTQTVSGPPGATTAT